MRKIHSLIVLVLVLSCLCSSAFGQAGRNQKVKDHNSFDESWGFGFKASTNGIGIEVIKGFGEGVNLRIGTSSLNLPYDQIIDVQGFDLLANAQLGFGGINGFIDVHLTPLIHVTGGIIKNNMYHTVRITSAGDFPLGTVEVPASEVGYVLAELSPEKSFSPYLGIGIGRSLSVKSNFSLNFEIGGIYHGEPQLDLTGDGIIGPIASEENRRIIMEAIAPYKWYPLLTLQFGIRLK